MAVAHRSRGTRKVQLKDQDRPRSSVYVVQAGPKSGPVKVGVTEQDIRTRLLGIQNGCPEPLSVVIVVPGGRGLEQALHRVLQPYRIGGEWFNDKTNEICLAGWLKRLEHTEWRMFLMLAGSQRCGFLASLATLCGLNHHRELLRFWGERDVKKLRLSLQEVLYSPHHELSQITDTLVHISGHQAAWLAEQLSHMSGQYHDQFQG